MRPKLKLREVAAAAVYDPKQALLDSLERRHLNIEVFHNKVLVATYIAPPIMMRDAAGKPVEFHLTDSGQSEDRFQGKVGLVLGLGPLAFKDDNIAKFGGVTLKEGDWVMTRPSDGLEFFCVDADGKSGTSCRIFSDVDIIARLDDPALVY